MSYGPSTACKASCEKGHRCAFELGHTDAPHHDPICGPGAIP